MIRGLDVVYYNEKSLKKLGIDRDLESETKIHSNLFWDPENIKIKIRNSLSQFSNNKYSIYEIDIMDKKLSTNTRRKWCSILI